MRERHADDPDPQRSPAPCLPVGGELPPRHLGVADSRYPGREVLPAAAAQGGDQVLRRCLEVDVGPVMAHVDRDRQDELHRRVEAPAVEPPAGVPHQLAALRISGVLADAPPERGAVDQGVMAGHVPDEDWMIGRRPVEVEPGRRPVRELGGIEAECLDPASGRHRRGRPGDQGDQACHRRDAGIPGVYPGQAM